MTIYMYIISIFYADSSLFIGMMTRQLLLKLLNDGDISDHQVRVFYAAVREYYCCAATYALSNLPLHDDVLQNATFINFEARESATIDQVTYFVSRYMYTVHVLYNDYT